MWFGEVRMSWVLDTWGVRPQWHVRVDRSYRQLELWFHDTGVTSGLAVWI